MPRTVQLALVVVGIYGVLGLAALAHAVLELAGGSSLAPFEQVFSIVSLTSGAVLVLMTARGLVRRREQARMVAFICGFALAIMFGIMGMTFAVILVSKASAPSVTLIEPAMTCVAAGLGAVSAWSLSRPSAKAWFASAPPGGHVGRG